MIQGFFFQLETKSGHHALTFVHDFVVNAFERYPNTLLRYFEHLPKRLGCGGSKLRPVRKHRFVNPERNLDC